MTEAAPVVAAPMSASPSAQQFNGKEKPVAVRLSNIIAAKSVADVIRTSLGPRGMDKMIRTGRGERSSRMTVPLF